MSAKVVHHDDIAGAQLRDQYGLDIGLEGGPVDRTGDDEGCDHAAQAQRADEGGGLGEPPLGGPT